MLSYFFLIIIILKKFLKILYYLGIEIKFWIHLIITLSEPIMIDLEEDFGITMDTYDIVEFSFFKKGIIILKKYEIYK